MIFRLLLLSLCVASIACRSQTALTGTRLLRTGDEIIIAGQFFHTGAPVVTWLDPGGYDGYRTERRFVPYDQAAFGNQGSPDDPARFGLRKNLTDAERAQVRGGGWTLPLLQQKVDQFVIHYDVAGTSRQCFNILHDHRGLSVHFMLDVDGTIYQTLDVKERAYHATKANDRSVGIEIASIGAYPPDDAEPLSRWYQQDTTGRTRLIVPDREKSFIRSVGSAPVTRVSNPWADHGLDTRVTDQTDILRPARDAPVTGVVQGQQLVMYDLTPQQYDSLIKLTATLCTVLPKITCDVPRNADGSVIEHALSDEDWQQYRGMLGHYHVQTNKQDPGPAFQWEKVVDGAKRLMR